MSQWEQTVQKIVQFLEDVVSRARERQRQRERERQRWKKTPFKMKTTMDNLSSHKLTMETNEEIKTQTINSFYLVLARNVKLRSPKITDPMLHGSSVRIEYGHHSYVLCDIKVGQRQGASSR